MDVAAQLARVNERVRAAEQVSGRPAGGTHLVAVSKTYGEDMIWPAIMAGQRLFGENRVQEAMSKWPALRSRLDNDSIELHLIGPLQSNKVREAVATFDVIESVDREKIAAALSAEMMKQSRFLPCYVQVNTGNEPQKAGISAEACLQFVERCRDVHGLTVVGLMCIPPFDEDPRPHFETLMSLGNAAALPHLSMGMSGDFEVAIAVGATHVRVGSAIFGARTPSDNRLTTL